MSDMDEPSVDPTMTPSGQRRRAKDSTQSTARSVVASKDSLPLTAIRVFVEAARHLSFSAAARALGMTQSGVSHHVAALETNLGQALFVRVGPAVTLTEAGRLYFDTVQDAIATIELATRQLRQPSMHAQRLVVRTSLPTLAMTVLIPALPDFASTLMVDVVTSLSPPAPGEVYDVLVTRDLHVDGADQWLLTHEELVCVASPMLYQTHGQQSPGQWPFLVSLSRPDVLPAWCTRHRVETASVRVVASLAHYFLAIPAAIGGLGFLIIPRLLVGEPLMSGQLIEVPGYGLAGDADYRACLNPRSQMPDQAQAFCRWLGARLRPSWSPRSRHAVSPERP